MSSTQESLFSLELVIDNVRFDASRADVSEPAVGVRFLDFPTLLIYQSGREDLPSKPGYADLCVSPEALSPPDDGDERKFPFHKGKSCLFRINVHSLHTHLLNTPLYAMVLDVKDEIPKLIGSSLISLAKVTERIQLDVDKRGINSPSAHGERLISPVCNLMGNSIGSISLAYKIVSLGAQLIPHIPDSRVYEAGVNRGRGEQQPSVDIKCEKDDMQSKAPENRDVLSQQISLAGQPTDVVISEAKQPWVSAFTQTEQAKLRVSWCEDVQENSPFCPPPLFYSSSVKNRLDNTNFTGFLAAMENLDVEDPEDRNDEESSDVHEFPKVDKSRKATSTPRIRQKETDSAPLGDVIRQLPLLNALLVELSQLNVQTQQPLSIHPHLAWLYTSTPQPSEPAAKPRAENQNTSPKQRPGQSKTKRGTQSAKSPKKNEEKLRPKRTLKCGLTNTFRLRLKLVKSDLTKRHECIEYQNIKQEQPKRQASSDHKRVRRSVRGVSRLDETVETLISSFEMKPTDSGKSQRQSGTQRRHSNEEALWTERDKNLQVHIPSLFSDHSDTCSASSGPALNIKNPGFQSREDVRPASRPHPSDGSFEQDEYQDDFTSLNTTDGYSPDPLSSPEPNRRKRNSPSSSSSASRPRKGLPVPAKAENSPQRSLKSTHVIRPRLQTSALSVSSDDSEDESSGSRRRHRPGSQSSGQNTPSVRRTFGKSESSDSEPGAKGVTFSRVSEDFDLPANKPVLKSTSSSDHTDAEEERDNLGSLGLDRNYHHISELVINKLPGYTL